MNLKLIELTGQMKYVVKSVDCVDGGYVYNMEPLYLEEALRQAVACEYKMVHFDTVTYFIFRIDCNTYVRVLGDTEVEIAKEVFGYNFQKMRELAEEPTSD